MHFGPLPPFFHRILSCGHGGFPMLLPCAPTANWGSTVHQRLGQTVVQFRLAFYICILSWSCLYLITNTPCPEELLPSVYWITAGARWATLAQGWDKGLKALLRNPRFCFLPIPCTALWLLTQRVAALVWGKTPAKECWCLCSCGRKSWRKSWCKHWEVPETRLLMASLQKCVAKFPEQPWSMSFAVWVGVKKLFQNCFRKFQRKLNNRGESCSSMQIVQAHLQNTNATPAQHRSPDNGKKKKKSNFFP